MRQPGPVEDGGGLLGRRARTCATAPVIADLEAGRSCFRRLPRARSNELNVTANVTAHLGSVTNAATATVPVGTTDPDTANNTNISDTDHGDAIGVQLPRGFTLKRLWFFSNPAPALVSRSNFTGLIGHADHDEFPRQFDDQQKLEHRQCIVITAQVTMSRPIDPTIRATGAVIFWTMWLQGSIPLASPMPVGSTRIPCGPGLRRTTAILTRPSLLSPTRRYRSDREPYDHHQWAAWEPT